MTADRGTPTSVVGDLVDLVEEATRAPSSHNTQPWRFEVRQDRIRLFADRARALRSNDPEDRELTISCGAALLTLRVAAAAAGHRADVHALPGDDADLLAEVVLEIPSRRDDLADLSPAIHQRRTWRRAFSDQPLPPGLVDRLAAACTAEGAQLHVVAPQQRRLVAQLVAEGDRNQLGDRQWRRELAGWMRRRRSSDGLVADPISRLVVRSLDVARLVAAHDARLVQTAPLLVLVSTDKDGPLSWLAAGQALQRLLLVAAGAGVQAGYLNQPCQVASLRGRLAQLLEQGGSPQLLLRLGRPPRSAQATPRRPLDQVVRT